MCSYVNRIWGPGYLKRLHLKNPCTATEHFFLFLEHETAFVVTSESKQLHHKGSLLCALPLSHGPLKACAKQLCLSGGRQTILATPWIPFLANLKKTRQKLHSIPNMPSVPRHHPIRGTCSREFLSTSSSFSLAILGVQTCPHRY